MIFRILILLFISIVYSQAQTDSVFLKTDLRILAPELDVDLSGSLQSKVERKVISIFTKNGVINSKGSTFAVHPMLNVLEYGKLEGIAIEQTVQLELNLLVKNIFSEKDFMVFSRTLNGVGKTKKAAINNAISNLRPHRKAYTKFVHELDEKINTYYQDECASISARAQKAYDQNAFDKVVTLLHALPANSDCKTNNQALLDKAYEQYQAQNCESLLKEAEVAILKKEYKTTINLIGQIDAQSPCKNDAQQLLQSVTQKVDEQTARKMAFLNKVYGDNVEIEKARQQNMKSISNTYIEGIKKD